MSIAEAAADVRQKQNAFRLAAQASISSMDRSGSQLTDEDIDAITGFVYAARDLNKAVDRLLEVMGL